MSPPRPPTPGAGEAPARQASATFETPPDTLPLSSSPSPVSGSGPAPPAAPPPPGWASALEDPAALQRPDAEVRLAVLASLLAEVWEGNAFYRAKWRGAGLRGPEVASIAELARFPFTSREELLRDQRQSPPLGTNLTFPRCDYRHLHTTSGTTGSPLYWADTETTWSWLLASSRALYELAGVKAWDSVFLAVTPGRSMGSWVLLEGARRLGCAVHVAGASTPIQDLEWLTVTGATVVVAQPLQLLQLAGCARGHGLEASSLGSFRLISSGAPGACRPNLRAELEDLWGAPVFDRYGLTEAGSVAGECTVRRSALHLLEHAFVAEAIDPVTAAPLPEGEMGELVLTTLGRVASPIVRYRTGDLVTLVREPCSCGRTGILLVGGVTRSAGGGPLASGASRR